MFISISSPYLSHSISIDDCTYAFGGEEASSDEEGMLTLIPPPHESAGGDTGVDSDNEDAPEGLIQHLPTSTSHNMDTVTTKMPLRASSNIFLPPPSL